MTTSRKLSYPQSSISSGSSSTELYRDVEIAQFSVGDHVLWTAAKEFRQRSPEKLASCPDFGVGIIHRIVRYVPKSGMEYILAFVYFLEWVPDSVEVTWPDGDCYYRLLLPVSDLSPLDNKVVKPLEKSSSESVQPVIVRPCLLNNASKLTHPIIIENSTIFNIHKKRGVKGIVTGFFATQDGNSYIEADFELEIYPNELTHDSFCDHDSNGCDYRIAINLNNLSQDLWDSEFKLVVNNKKVRFEDLLFESKPSSTPPKPLQKNLASEAKTTRPITRVVASTPKKSYLKPTQPVPVPHNLVIHSPPNLNPSPPARLEPSPPPLNTSVDRNHKSVTSLMKELGSKLTLRKKKPSSKKESSNPNPIQTTKPAPVPNSTLKTSNSSTLPKSTVYVGEYYNDFSVSEGAENPPRKFQFLPKPSLTKPPTLKPSFRSNKSYPAPPPPPPSFVVPEIEPVTKNTSPITNNVEVPSHPINSGPPPPPLQLPLLVPPPPPPPPSSPKPSKFSPTQPHPSSGSRSDLLQQIRSGVSLRHVDADKKHLSSSSLASSNKLLPNGGPGDFASIMMGALAKRRTMIDNDSDDSSGSDVECGNGILDQKDTDHDNGWD